MASSLKKIITRNSFLKKKYYKYISFKNRYGRKYKETLSLLKCAKLWSYSQAKDYQLENLKNILSVCRNIPYYKKLFKDNGFDPDIKKIEDIENLPYLTKDIIINNFNDLINPFFEGKRYKLHTSGTTGKRLVILGTDDLYKVEAAFITNAFNDHNSYLYQDHSIWIRRYSPKAGDPIHFDDLELNRSYMSAFNLNDETVCDYVEYINSKKSETLVSYPSTLYYLSILCEKLNLKLDHVKHMHGASEPCLDQWKDKIKQVFSIDIKMHYGQVERVCFAHQDYENNYYKENLLYGYKELSNKNVIVATGFHNYLMPLLRYKTNDIVKPFESYDDSAFPRSIESIEGRECDMLLNSSGYLVPAINFYTLMSKTDSVDMFQITQIKKDKSVLLDIVVNEKFSLKSEQALRKEMSFRLGDVNVEIRKVDRISRDLKTQKFKAVKLV
jgi:phenylacetate-CoA ligase